MTRLFLLLHVTNDRQGIISGAGVLLLLLVSGALLSGGCTADQPFLEKSDKTASQVYFVGVGHLRVRDVPDMSGSVITTLRQHQKVYRYRIENGFARIKVDGSGTTGWVVNAHLIQQLPEQEPEKPASKPTGESNKPADPAPGASGPEDETEPAASPESAAPSVDPSRFDPF